MQLAHTIELERLPESMLKGFASHSISEADISQRLHQHLDPEQVIRCYARELAPRLRFTWLKYSHQTLDLAIGRTQSTAIRYAMSLTRDGITIGEISYGFSQCLSPAQLSQLNGLHTKLSQPLFVAWQFAELKSRLEQEPLTGLLNRGSFDRQLDERILRSLRSQETFSLLLLDLDHFKAVNDNHGHAAGDEVLRWIGDTLRGAIRPQDRAFRFGGDEFAVLLDADHDTAEQVAERLRHKIQALPQLQRYGITCSIGYGQHLPEEDRERLFQRCDEALYQAKAAGRNCQVCY